MVKIFFAFCCINWSVSIEAEGNVKWFDNKFAVLDESLCRNGSVIILSVEAVDLVDVSCCFLVDDRRGEIITSPPPPRENENFDFDGEGVLNELLPILLCCKCSLLCALLSFLEGVCRSLDSKLFEWVSDIEVLLDKN